MKRDLSEACDSLRKEIKEVKDSMRNLKTAPEWSINQNTVTGRRAAIYQVPAERGFYIGPAARYLGIHP